jgi:hypothetical protein
MKDRTIRGAQIQRPRQDSKIASSCDRIREEAGRVEGGGGGGGGGREGETEGLSGGGGGDEGGREGGRDGEKETG